VLVLGTLFTGALVSQQPAGAVGVHDSTIYAFGSATFRGSTDGKSLYRPIAGMANTANGQGYWIVLQDGAVYSFNAPYYGGLAGYPLGYPVVGMAATKTGKGYWLVTSDGTVFPFGDAKWYGGMSRARLSAPIKAIIPGPGGLGYWLYAGDGGVFTFGSAKFYGSTGARRLNSPVVSMAATTSGRGYWLVAGDGGIFTFGDARFFGSTGNKRLNAPVIGMATSGNGLGYWLAATDGGVFSFGNAPFRGSAAGQVYWGKYVAQMAGMPDGNGYRMLSLPAQPDVGLMAMGARGNAVADAQRRLSNQGYWLPSINGVFDANMQQAVWAFQKANNLPRTGQIDPATQMKFRTASRPRPRTTSGSVIEIDKRRQIIMIASNGYTRYVFNTSTGSDIPYSENGESGSAHTPEGSFTMVTSYNGLQKGPLGTLYRPRYFTWAGHAIHGSPSIPPYPASHGCARVSNDAINFIWAANLAPMGIRVWVY
jgi:peptidoglycan hydrolase-like protein with peptidoglycan-binding domain